KGPATAAKKRDRVWRLYCLADHRVLFVYSLISPALLPIDVILGATAGTRSASPIPIPGSIMFSRLFLGDTAMQTSPRWLVRAVFVVVFVSSGWLLFGQTRHPDGGASTRPLDADRIAAAAGSKATT